MGMQYSRDQSVLCYLSEVLNVMWEHAHTLRSHLAFEKSSAMPEFTASGRLINLIEIYFEILDD